MSKLINFIIEQVDKRYNYHRRKNDKDADKVNAVLNQIEHHTVYQARWGGFQAGWNAALKSCKREMKGRI